jgi:hypothetical protein
VEPRILGTRLRSTRAYRDYRARVPSRLWQSGCSGRRRRVRHDLLLLGPLSHQLPRLKDRLARSQLCDRPAHSAAVPRRLTSLSLGSVTRMVSDTSRPTGRSSSTTRPSTCTGALYPLRLRVVESHHVTRSDVTGRDVLYRHRPTVGRRGAEWPPRN